MANYKNQKNNRGWKRTCAANASNVYEASVGARALSRACRCPQLKDTMSISEIRKTVGQILGDHYNIGEKPVMGSGADKKDALTDNVTDVFDFIDDSGDFIDDVGDILDDVGDLFDSFLKDVKEIFGVRDKR